MATHRACSMLLLLACLAGSAPAATFTTLYSFAGGSDGSRPQAGLVAGPDGSIYSTTTVGGAFGRGTVFRLAPPATPQVDGVNPYAGLVADGSGALYGVTYLGGTADWATVFKLTPPASAGGAWTKTTLHNFTGQNGEGQAPYGGLVFGAGRALYGTTDAGGTSGNGTVFALR